MSQKIDDHLPHIQILLLAIKEEDILEVYLRKAASAGYMLAAQLPILTRSGKLGPKRQEGDLQVPEGLYTINRFNPKSKYHLSLGLDYPNAYDQDKGYTGSDIFIHGGTETKGCLPLGDDGIEFLYGLAEIARKNGQNAIPVYIFPFRYSNCNWQQFSATRDLETQAHWNYLADIWQEVQARINGSL